MLTKPKLFLSHNYILPELLRKWYMRPSSDIKVIRTDTPGPSGFTDGSDPQHEKKYCNCGGQDEGRMTGCENNDCIIEWFHTSCLLN